MQAEVHQQWSSCATVSDKRGCHDGNDPAADSCIPAGLVSHRQQGVIRNCFGRKVQNRCHSQGGDLQPDSMLSTRSCNRLKSSIHVGDAAAGTASAAQVQVFELPQQLQVLHQCLSSLDRPHRQAVVSLTE